MKKQTKPLGRPVKNIIEPINRKAKTVKKINQQRLNNIAIHYMDRFGGTKKSLTDVLNRRVYKAKTAHPDEDYSQVKMWIDDIAAIAQRLGYINDSAFAKGRVKTLSRRGSSKKMIVLKLQQKGISADDIAKAVVDLDQDSELQSAIAYAEKRKFGIYGANEDRKKQLASLARQGFSYTIANQALDGTEN